MEKPETIWTLLLFGGYLTVENQGVQKSLAEQVAQFNRLGTASTKINCHVRIPNREIAAQYEEIFASWFKESINASLGADRYDHFLRNLIEGRIEKFEADLQKYMTNALSVRDVHGKQQSERFYHGFMAGLIGSLRHDFNIHSNKEGGSGFYDLALVPKSRALDKFIIIIECKVSESLKDLEKDAMSAVTQVEMKQYIDAFLNDYTTIKDLEKIQVITVGLAFRNKKVKSAHQKISLANLLKKSESL